MPKTTDRHPLDWNAKLVRFFIGNPRLAWILIAVLLIGGLTSLTGLRREGFPQTVPKILLVQTAYPGAAASEVDSQVTRYLESAVKDAKGVKETSSTSQNSFSNIVIQFDDSVNIDQAIQEVQSKVQSARADLPKDAEAPKVQNAVGTNPSFLYGISDGSNDIAAIRTEAQKVASIIGSVKGVKSAKLATERKEQVTIGYNAGELVKKGVSLTALTQVLQASNVTFPAGTLDIDNKQQNIASVGTIGSLDELKRVIVGASPQTGQPIYLEDVATISTDLSNAETIERFGKLDNGSSTSSVGTVLTVEITSDSDILTVREAINQKIDSNRSSGELADTITITSLQDQAQSTEDQIREILSAAIGSKANLWLLGGIQLLFLAMLLFVNWRAALVATLSIPLSLGFTFITLSLLGIQLNTMVLFSLILVLGLIVDPAIVMVEAIQRYRDINYAARESVLESGRRYGASIFIAVLTSLIVFLPFGVVSGIFGQIIKYIPITVIPALIASYFVPLALLPLIMERVIKKVGDGTESAEEHHDLSKAAEAVMRFNAWILSSIWREIAVLVVSVLLMAGSLSIVALGKVTIVQFSTPKDNQQLGVTVQYVKALTFARRDEIAKHVEQDVVKEQGVKQFYYANQSADGFTMYIELKPKSERTAESDASKQIVSRIRDSVTKEADLSEVTASEVAIGPPTSSYQIENQLYSNDPDILEKAAKNVGDFLRSTDNVSKVDDGFTGKEVQQLQVILNREKVSAAGLTSLEVGASLRSLLDQTEVTKLDIGSSSESKEVYLVNASLPKSTADIGELSITSRTGKQVLVKDIATIEPRAVTDAIERSNGSRYVTVKAKVDDQKNVLAVQTKLNDYLTDAKIKDLGLESKDSRGEFDDISKSFKELGIALAIAILLTYVLLVLQFKSFSQPVIMLFTIPLSLIGVFPALFLTGSDLGFLELLGVTILVGIVENVAIFLIDYANQQIRENGLTTREAIIQASGVRFRPIILTKLVALAGMLPLAIESEFWRGLAVVIIAGIGLSGFFSLVVIPVLYVWLAGIRGRLHGKFGGEL